MVPSPETPTRTYQEGAAELVLDHAKRKAELDFRSIQLKAALEAIEAELKLSKDHRLTPDLVVDALDKDKNIPFSKRGLDEALEKDKSHPVDSVGQIIKEGELDVVLTDKNGCRYHLEDLQKLIDNLPVQATTAPAKAIAPVDRSQYEENPEFKTWIKELSDAERGEWSKKWEDRKTYYLSRGLTSEDASFMANVDCGRYKLKSLK